MNARTKSTEEVENLNLDSKLGQSSAHVSYTWRISAVYVKDWSSLTELAKDGMFIEVIMQKLRCTVGQINQFLQRSVPRSEAGSREGGVGTVHMCLSPDVSSCLRDHQQWQTHCFQGHLINKGLSTQPGNYSKGFLFLLIVPPTF